MVRSFVLFLFLYLLSCFLLFRNLAEIGMLLVELDKLGVALLVAEEQESPGRPRIVVHTQTGLC